MIRTPMEPKPKSRNRMLLAFQKPSPGKIALTFYQPVPVIFSLYSETPCTTVASFPKILRGRCWGRVKFYGSTLGL